MPAMLYNWLSQTEDNPEASEALYARGQQLLDGLKKVPRYSKVSHRWRSPWHINFQSLRFPDDPSWPLWSNSRLPIAQWLEENHHIFKAELQAIIDAPDDIYGQLRRADGSRECLASPGGWEVL